MEVWLFIHMMNNLYCYTATLYILCCCEVTPHPLCHPDDGQLCLLCLSITNPHTAATSHHCDPFLYLKPTQSIEAPTLCSLNVFKLLSGSENGKLYTVGAVLLQLLPRGIQFQLHSKCCWANLFHVPRCHIVPGLDSLFWLILCSECSVPQELH